MPEITKQQATALAEKHIGIIATAEQWHAFAKAAQSGRWLWRKLDDPPKKSGRYIVGHAGNVGGDAYYTARKGDMQYPVGWAQMPEWRPTHWLDVSPPQRTRLTKEA